MKRCLVCEHGFESKDWRCPRCRFEPGLSEGILRFTTDPPSDDAPGFKPEYFARLAGFEEKNFWFRARNRLIQWAVRNYFPQASNFFEIGCGTGFVLQGLRETAPHLDLAGSEIFRDGLAFAQARLPGVTLYQMDARQLPFQEEWDIVGAFDVLEHVVEDEAVLEQMFRATRPGGGILLTVPQHPFLWSGSDEHSMHQRRYDRTDLLDKVQRAGFRVRRMTSFVSLLLPLMVASRRSRKRRRDFDLWEEFKIGAPLNAAFGFVLTLERALIMAGVSFPAGGSLLLIAERPADS